MLGRIHRNGSSRLRTADGWVSEFSAKHDRRLVELLDPHRDLVEQLMAAMGVAQDSTDKVPELHIDEDEFFDCVG